MSTTWENCKQTTSIPSSSIKSTQFWIKRNFGDILLYYLKNTVGPVGKKGEFQQTKYYFSFSVSLCLSQVTIFTHQIYILDYFFTHSLFYHFYVMNTSSSSTSSYKGPSSLYYPLVKLASPAESTGAGANPTGADLYARFALAGALCCAITHGALTPVSKKMDISLLVFHHLIFIFIGWCCQDENSIRANRLQ